MTVPRMPFPSLPAVREAGRRFIEAGDLPGALAAYREGVRLFPDDLDLWQQLRRLFQATGDLEGARHAGAAIATLQAAKRQGVAPTPHDAGFYRQQVRLTPVPDRMEVIVPLCTGKKVLHVGCTDHPIFDPERNLHIQLSRVCGELHGMDVDEEGIEELRRHVPGRFYTDPREVTEKYDVLLVPETIEHVDNVREFLESLDRIRFRHCLITAPNAFIPERNGSHWESPGVFVEVVHPDHNAWFSPYTLKRTITKFTPWRILESYLMHNETMIGCLCERLPGRPAGIPARSGEVTP